MVRTGIMSPPRSRFSLTSQDNPNNKAAATAKRPTKNKDGSSPTVPSTRRPAASPSPREKKLGSKKDNINSSPQPSSPSPSTKPNKPSPKGVGTTYASGSKFSNRTPKIGSQNRRSSPLPSPTALQQPDVPQQLFQNLSLDGVGKELADILLNANKMDESLISSNKKEESSSESNDNGSKIFKIYKEIASHRQENLSITSYFTKLKALWDELATYTTDLPQCRSCGAIEKLNEHTDREKVKQFLVGLDDSYATICAQILLMSPFPTVEEAYSVIIGEEKRRESVDALETFAAEVIQKYLLLQNQNGHSNNGDNKDGIQEVIDRNEVRSLPTEPLLTDLGSPVRC